MGKSSNSREKLAFRAARRRVLSPHLHRSLINVVKPLYETAGLVPPSGDDLSVDDDKNNFNRPGSWSGVEVVPNFVRSERGRVLNPVHSVKKDVEMGEANESEGLVNLEDRVREAEIRKKRREESETDFLMIERRGRKDGGCRIGKRRKRKTRHPKNKPSIKF